MSTQPLKLLSVNIEKYHHIAIVLEFLKKERADILCIQEVFEETFELFKKEINHPGASPQGMIGSMSLQ
ncbi:MAG: endonuclease/exonuclease/phosphatase family protein [bacterium]|nr:endonuclease/exonuclease/phosphatase family protein [bacterium]